MLVRVLVLLIIFLSANVLSSAQGCCPNLAFSVQPLCSLRLCGDFPEGYTNHRDTNGYVVPANFGTPEFQRREAAIVESRPPESLEGLKDYLQLLG
jgi:hypothetical protein